MLKVLTILSVIQTCLLILLFSRTTALESEVASQSPNAPSVPSGNSFLSPSVDSSSGDAFSSIDEFQLRQIIREELGAYAATSSNPDGRVSESATYDPDTAAKRQVQLDLVSQKIEYYSSLGSISEIEMGDLEMEIARLDAAGRREMLRKLTQALNSGTLDGRF